jgi:hypothetical protein
MEILFLVGDGSEEPTIIDELLNIEKYPSRPSYSRKLFYIKKLIKILYEVTISRMRILWFCLIAIMIKLNLSMK